MRLFKVIYKIHPEEKRRYRDYSDLMYLENNHDNFTVEVRGDLYDLLSRSSRVIGVFSTAIYEAIAFNCEIFICKLDGWEYMQELLTKGIVKSFEAFDA